MKTLLLFLLVGAMVVSQTEACGQCPTDHPQQHYCKSDFVVRVEILETFRDPAQGTMNVNRALVKDGMKLGRKKTGKTIEFYSPSSFCGTQFFVRGDYVITGSKETRRDGSKYLMHGSCDFGMEWDDLSPQQQKGFTKKYARYCECEIESSRSATNIKVEDLSFDNTYPDARTYWTPDVCYYNPHKSREFSEIEDCEEEFSYCAPGGDRECNWQLSPDYETCFKERDDFVLVDSGAFAITDPEQCNVLSTRRQRKKCRKRIKQTAVMNEEGEIEIPFY
nr:(D)tensilin [Holothuria forskali]